MEIVRPDEASQNEFLETQGDAKSAEIPICSQVSIPPMDTNLADEKEDAKSAENPIGSQESIPPTDTNLTDETETGKDMDNGCLHKDDTTQDNQTVTGVLPGQTEQEFSDDENKKNKDADTATTVQDEKVDPTEPEQGGIENSNPINYVSPRHPSTLPTSINATVDENIGVTTSECDGINFINSSPSRAGQYGRNNDVSFPNSRRFIRKQVGDLMDFTGNRLKELNSMLQRKRIEMKDKDALQKYRSHNQQHQNPRAVRPSPFDLAPSSSNGQSAQNKARGNTPRTSPWYVEYFDAENVIRETEHCCRQCDEDFTQGEQMVRLPCQHHFHIFCFQQVQNRNGKCPVCSRPIR